MLPSLKDFRQRDIRFLSLKRNVGTKIKTEFVLSVIFICLLDLMQTIKTESNK